MSGKMSGWHALSAHRAGRGDPRDARGRGMFVAFDLPGQETRDRVLQQMREAGVLALPSGDNAISFRPPLNLSTEEADEALRRTGQALEATL